MAWEEIIFEAVKLALQFGGALYIAWRAVRWALGRYKEEKHWERRMVAYTDLLNALGTMHQVQGLWERSEIEDRDMSEDAQIAARARYAEAKIRLEEAIGIAQLLLPRDVADIVARLIPSIENASKGAHSFLEAIGEEWAVVEIARAQIIKMGRADLGIRDG